MPGFVSRWWGWFRARPGAQKALIAVVALIVLLLLSRVVWIAASVGFVVALIVLIYRLARRRPLRAWATATLALLAAGLVFGGISNVIYGPTRNDQAKVPRVEKPKPEKQEPKPTHEGKASKPNRPPKPNPSPKPEQKPPQERSLYRRAVLEPLAPYKVVYTSDDTTQRLDAYVVTERTTNKPRLGRILVDLQENSQQDPDLVTAYFCTKPDKQDCTNTMFATGEYAATAQGKGFMTGEQVLSKVGEWPSIKVEF